MIKVRCPFCGTKHEPFEDHECSTSQAEEISVTTRAPSLAASGMETPPSKREHDRLRVARWRDRRRDHYNAYMRDLRKKLRKEKAS